MTDRRRESLFERLRRAPSASSVRGSLPVLFFGDLFKAEIVTVGLNPSKREYLDESATLLAGRHQRFATLDSLGAGSREMLSDKQCDKAVRCMREYFGPKGNAYSWFRNLDRVIAEMGAGFKEGNAAHLDLVQESTTLSWSDLRKRRKAELDRLLHQDLPFLEWAILAFRPRAVICNGKTVGENVIKRFGVTVHEEEPGPVKLRWWTGHAQVGGGAVGFAGWNHPLQPGSWSGLDEGAEKRLGRKIARKLRVRLADQEGAPRVRKHRSPSGAAAPARGGIN